MRSKSTRGGIIATRSPGPRALTEAERARLDEMNRLIMLQNLVAVLRLLLATSVVSYLVVLILAN